MTAHAVTMQAMSDELEFISEAILDGEPEETVDGLPILADVRPLERASPTVLPAVQAAAVAATGFVAGAATIALVRRHGARKLARSQRSMPRRAVDMLPIAGSRTFLVDVHLLAKPGE
jgi:anti-sigma factor RsiW